MMKKMLAPITGFICGILLSVTTHDMVASLLAVVVGASVICAAQKVWRPIR